MIKVNYISTIEFVNTLNKVDPPDNTMFLNNTLRRSKSDFCIENINTSCNPSHSSPIKYGLNNTSGARYLAGPILIVFPSGSK